MKNKKLKKLSLNQGRIFLEYASTIHSEDEMNVIKNRLSERMDDDDYLELMTEASNNDISKLCKIFYTHIIKFVCTQNTRNLSAWLNTISIQSRLISKKVSKNVIRNFENKYENIIEKSIEDAIIELSKYHENIAIARVKEFSVPDDLFRDIEGFVCNQRVYTQFLIDNISPEFKDNASDVIKNYFRKR